MNFQHGNELLPQPMLSTIFKFLSLFELLHIKRVCHSYYSAWQSPISWTHCVVNLNALARLLHKQFSADEYWGGLVRMVGTSLRCTQKGFCSMKRASKGEDADILGPFLLSLENLQHVGISGNNTEINRIVEFLQCHKKLSKLDIFQEAGPVNKLVSDQSRILFVRFPTDGTKFKAGAAWSKLKSLSVSMDFDAMWHSWGIYSRIPVCPFQLLTAFTHLETVELNYGTVEGWNERLYNDVFQTMSTQLTNLTLLTNKPDRAINAIVTHLKHLHTLHLGDCSLLQETSEFAKIQSLAQLKDLTLDSKFHSCSMNSQYEFPAWDLCIESLPCAQIKRLALRALQGWCSEKSATRLSKIIGLKTLTVEFSTLHMWHIVSFTSLPILQQLQRLVILRLLGENWQTTLVTSIVLLPNLQSIILTRQDLLDEIKETVPIVFQRIFLSRHKQAIQLKYLQLDQYALLR